MPFMAGKCFEMQHRSRRGSRSQLWPSPSTSPVSFLLISIFLSLTVMSKCEELPQPWDSSLARHEPPNKRADEPPLENFQVSSPVYSPSDSKCEQTLMTHSFGQSYGQPFVGPFSPPPCDFNKVVLNLTVTSKGNQFDRLALMYLNDTEVFRTSTAEPTFNGIVWTYTKDMSAMLPLFKQPQKIIFQLDNNVDDTYTGAFNTTLSATYFSQEDVPPTADMIIPMSTRNSSMDVGSAFRVPMDTAINSMTLPKNMKKAIFTMSACGQADEEFWWSNMPSSVSDTFSDVASFGNSSFREVQLLIDGELAGVSWPFPVIFTGGVVPGFWRPVAGIDAFDLREDEIDISPWIPVLADGNEHSFEMRVVGITDDGNGQANLTDAVGSNWPVTGKIFLWLDERSNATVGSMFVRNTPDPELQVLSHTNVSLNGTSTMLQYSVLAQRNIEITAKIQDSDGERNVSWKQSLTYSNAGNLTEDGNSQVVSQMTTGIEASSSGYARRFSYPLFSQNSFADNTATGGNMTMNGTIDRSRDEQITGRGVLGTPIDALAPENGSNKPKTYAAFAIRNRQNATATLDQNMEKNVSASTGETRQQYFLNGMNIDDIQDAPQTLLDAAPSGTELYNRNVLAKDARVVDDDQAPRALEGFIANDVVSKTDPQFFAFGNMREMLGRGPVRRRRRRL